MAVGRAQTETSVRDGTETGGLALLLLLLLLMLMLILHAVHTSSTALEIGLIVTPPPNNSQVRSAIGTAPSSGQWVPGALGIRMAASS